MLLRSNRFGVDVVDRAGNSFELASNLTAEQAIEEMARLRPRWSAVLAFDDENPERGPLDEEMLRQVDDGRI